MTCKECKDRMYKHCEILPKRRVPMGLWVSGPWVHYLYLPMCNTITCLPCAAGLQSDHYSDISVISTFDTLLVTFKWLIVMEKCT